MNRAENEKAGRDRANSLSPDDNYGWTKLTDEQLAAGVQRTQNRLNQATTDEAVFAAARDNQRYTNEQERRTGKRGTR